MINWIQFDLNYIFFFLTNNYEFDLCLSTPKFRMGSNKIIVLKGLSSLLVSSENFLNGVDISSST